MKKSILMLAGVACMAMATAAKAAIITFTGGTYTLNGGGTGVTAGNSNIGNVDFYEENGFKLDFVSAGTATFGDSYVGTYYGGTNDVIHAHWDSGDYGTTTQIVGTKVGGGTFDLNYFVLTSNTDTGGGAASGNEKVYITHDGGLDPILLNPENWGFPALQIFLPSTYDNIASFEFHTESAVDCFGMDEFYIDQAAPPSVPDTGSTLGLLGLGLAALARLKRRMK